mmetsp:Transcript_37495/g.117955  ORF Transcript_37495/g.117955 Transcript_37495/m.117955 type:complete len:269 (+) Transcript_37495:1148-1954(+)
MAAHHSYSSRWCHLGMAEGSKPLRARAMSCLTALSSTSWASVTCGKSSSARTASDTWASSSSQSGANATFRDADRVETSLGTFIEPPRSAASFSAAGPTRRPWTNPSSDASARERTSSAAPRSDCAHPKSRSRLYSGSPAASCRHARANPHRPACSLELRRTEATGWVRCVQTHTGTAAGRSICHCTMVSADAMLPSAAAARGGATRTTPSRAPASRSSEADPLSARRAMLRPSAAASVPRRSPTSKTRASWLGSAAAEATGAHSVAK